MLLKFLIYILVGIPINWIAVIFTWGLLGIVTRDDMKLYRELYQKYDRMKVGFPIAHWPLIFKMLLNMVVWPFSVMNHIYFGGRAVAEAISRKRSRDRNNSLDETNEKEENQ